MRKIEDEEAGMSPLLQFRAMGKMIYQDQRQELEIFAGDVFEGKTVRGSKNLIVAMRIHEDQQGKQWMIYMHKGPKKVPLQHFIRAVECGDLELQNPFEMDVERLSMADIMFDAFANRRSFEEALTVTENQLSEQLQQGNMIPR